MAGTDRFDVPPEMRVFAEKSVEQARHAFDGFIEATHRAFHDFEGHAETARQGARDVTEKAMTFAEQNIASTFEFAQALLRAKDLQDVMKLQADYFRRQMQMRAGAGAGREHHQGGTGRGGAEALTRAEAEPAEKAAATGT
jgi:phasin